MYSQDPKTIPNFYSLLGELPGLSRLLYSWLIFISVERYRTGSTKENVHGTKSGSNQAQASRVLSWYNHTVPA